MFDYCANLFIQDLTLKSYDAIGGLRLRADHIRPKFVFSVFESLLLSLNDGKMAAWPPKNDESPPIPSSQETRMKQ